MKINFSQVDEYQSKAEIQPSVRDLLEYVILLISLLNVTTSPSLDEKII